MEKEESLLFWKWKYFKQGIEAAKYKREHMKDIKDIIDIDNIMTDRENAAKTLRDSMQTGAG